MKKCKILLLLSVICLMILSLCGCGDTELLPSNHIIKKVEKTIPNAKFVSLVHEETTDHHQMVDEYGMNVYTFNNGKFDFTVKNSMLEAPNELIFGTQSNTLENDYMAQYMKYNWEKILDLGNNYNISIECQAMDDAEVFRTGKDLSISNLTIAENLDKSSKNICFIDSFDLVLNNSIKFDIYIDNFDDIQNVLGFVEDFYNSVVNDFPKSYESNLTYTTDFDVYVKTTSTTSSFGFEFTNICSNSVDYLLSSKDIKIEDYTAEWMKLRYATLLKEGKLINPSMSYEEAEKYPMTVMDRLIIDGEEITMKPPSRNRFYYNIEEETYYVPVFCGNEYDIRNCVGEYYQKELLEKYYPDCNYIYKDGEYKELKYSSYEINGDVFNISHKNGKYTYTKNNKRMNIGNCNYANIYGLDIQISCDYVEINDYAMLMGMTVEEIDNGRGIVYLTTK